MRKAHTMIAGYSGVNTSHQDHAMTPRSLSVRKIKNRIGKKPT